MAASIVVWYQLPQAEIDKVEVKSSADVADVKKAIRDWVDGLPAPPYIKIRRRPDGEALRPGQKMSDAEETSEVDPVIVEFLDTQQPAVAASLSQVLAKTELALTSTQRLLLLTEHELSRSKVELGKVSAIACARPLLEVGLNTLRGNSPMSETVRNWVLGSLVDRSEEDWACSLKPFAQCLLSVLQEWNIVSYTSPSLAETMVDIYSKLSSDYSHKLHEVVRTPGLYLMLEDEVSTAAALVVGGLVKDRHIDRDLQIQMVYKSDAKTQISVKSLTQAVDEACARCDSHRPQQDRKRSLDLHVSTDEQAKRAQRDARFN
mmetsp:Transcript_33439/g.74549  ORF Transcript_33439/g.74549 Transcript_33439/m.74549 type:complete len:319 (+) Transcript_33439:67-1023(+)